MRMSEPSAQEKLAYSSANIHFPSSSSFSSGSGQLFRLHSPGGHRDGLLAGWVRNRRLASLKFLVPPFSRTEKTMDPGIVMN